VANVLATLLTVSTTPATLLLEELARTQIRIEVLSRADRELTTAEHYRLEAGPITAGPHAAVHPGCVAQARRPGEALVSVWAQARVD